MKTRKAFKGLILTGLISVFLFSCSKKDEDTFEPPSLPEYPKSFSIHNTSLALNHYLWAYAYAENERDIANPEKVLAVMYKQITSDTTNFILQQDDGNWMPNGTEWIPASDGKYDVYIYTDSDDDGDPETGPTIGKLITPYPTSPAGSDNTMIATCTNSLYSRALTVTLHLDTFDITSHYLWATIYNENETDVNNPDKVVATMFIQITSVGGLAKITLQETDGNWEPNGTEWKGEIGKTYDIYVYTDSDDDNNPATGPTVGKIINPAPQTIFIKGYQSLFVVYEDMVDYVE